MTSKVFSSSGKNRVRWGVAISALFAIMMLVFTTLQTNNAVFGSHSTGIFDATNWTFSGLGAQPVTAPAVGEVKLNWDKPRNLLTTNRTYQTTALDTATVGVTWVFRSSDSFGFAVHRAYVFADGPTGRNEVRVANAQGGSIVRSGTIDI